MAVDHLLSITMSNETDRARVVPICIFVAVLCFCIVLGHLLKESRWVNQSITAILIGCCTGIIILLLSKGRSSHILRFDEELFFIYLLPPIIFNAGFQVKKKQFFHNFLTIMLFGVAGVFVSFVIISAGSWWLLPKIGFKALHIRDYLALGVIFSSTDTVCTLQVLHQDETPRLYSLVFGEGVVNDATSVVLFNAIKKIDVSTINGLTAARFLGDFLYLFSTSTMLGILSGLLAAYVLKALYFGRHSTDREIAIKILMAYLSYMMAELLRLSGILTVFFCGIVMSHYAWYNVSENSRISTRHIFATLSFIAETFIFLYVGMDALDIEKWRLSQTGLKTILGIDCIIMLLILVARAAFVFPLSILSNAVSAKAEGTSVTFRHQVIIWWAGLMRGAVSIALAYNKFAAYGFALDPVNATMITSTNVVVLFSTLVRLVCCMNIRLYRTVLFPFILTTGSAFASQFFGTLTKALVQRLLPHHAHGMSKSLSIDDITFPILPIEDAAASGIEQARRSLSMLFERPAHTIHAHWRRFDDTYMRPVFGGPN